MTRGEFKGETPFITDLPTQTPIALESVVSNSFGDQTEAVQQLAFLSNFLEHRAMVVKTFYYFLKHTITVVMVSNGIKLNKTIFMYFIEVKWQVQCVYGRKQVTFLSSPKQ